MTTRTDIHRPSAITPTEYQWIAFQYYGGSDLGALLAMKVERETTTKILVQAETGYKVWGSRFDNVEKGASVHFVASVQPSNDDLKFGFFKRPTVYVAPDAKKQQAKERKEQREADAAAHASNITNNPNFYNAYSPDYGKKL